MRSICILVLPRVFDSALVLIRDVLSSALARVEGPTAPGRARLLSLDGRSIRTAGGLRIETDGSLESERRADLVIVPGFGREGTDDLADIEGFLASRLVGEVTDWLVERHRAGATLAAGCTATFLLAQSGVLDGRQATTSWWAADLFRRRYPAVDLQPHMMLTHHDRVVCAGAAMAHMDLALWVVTAVHGPTVADVVARNLLLDERSSQARYMAANHLAHRHPAVLRAEAWIRAHLAEPIRIDDLARAVALSPRTLARRFAESTGETPLRFVQRLRAEHAVHLLQTSDLPFDEIAARVGYREPAGLRRVLRRETGDSPSELRRRRLSVSVEDTP